MKRPRARGTAVDKRRIAAWMRDFGAYRHAVGEVSIAGWLDQFEDKDRDLAARLLDVVEFYGADRISSAFKKSLDSLPGWNRSPGKRSGKWRFAAFAVSAGESGDTMLHQFRLANRLDGKANNDLFVHPSQLALEKLGAEDTLVFVDDFVGSGDQVCAAWDSAFEELVTGVGALYLVLVATSRSGRRRIADETGLSVVAGHELTESDNLFASDCSHFDAREKSALERYCMVSDKKQPRGYGDCGLVVVFQHRCPNDSVPVLHADNARWTGLFPRHD